MNANKAVLLLATLVFTCFTSVAFPQPAVDPLLAKFNALPLDERHAALVKGAQTERVVRGMPLCPSNIRKFSSRRFASVILLSKLNTPGLEEAEWLIAW